jgi:hypothetical protein
MLNVIMLTVVMLNVVAPIFKPWWHSHLPMGEKSLLARACLLQEFLLITKSLLAAATFNMKTFILVAPVS